MPWWRDKVLWAAMVVAGVLRGLPMALWPDDKCVRDECTYIRIAQRFVDGEGMTTSAGWLWAPAYPAIMAVHKALFGYAATIRGTQLVCAFGCMAAIYVLARRQTEDPILGRRAGRIAAWVYALSPSLAFYTVSLWSEAIYSLLLLTCFLVVDAARKTFDLPGRRALLWALGLGCTVGLCMLFRGVATYMIPLFMAGLLWRRWRQGRAWAQVAGVALGAFLVVSPYSAYATDKFGETVITDRTLGQMMWLGNNDFDPITFDYGNGQLSRRAFNRHIAEGRKPCAPRRAGLDRDSCQTEAGIAWIKANPVEFVSRMPMRVAQLLNPHSLLTRHLRWGKWKGPPQWMDEAVILMGALSSMLVIWGGALGLASRGRRARSGVVALVLLYHCAAIACLAGLSRYRVPLEPLLMIYVGLLLADPKGALEAMRAEPLRGIAGIAILAVLVPLVLWFLPSGWTWWRTW